LTAAEQQQFDEELLPEVLERTEDEYGLYVPTHEDAMEWSNWSDTDRRAGAPPALDEGESTEIMESDEREEDVEAQQPLDEISLDDGSDNQHDDRDDSNKTETTDDDPIDVANGAASSSIRLRTKRNAQSRTMNFGDGALSRRRDLPQTCP